MTDYRVILVLSLVSSGTTATATTAVPHGLTTGKTVSIGGAYPPEYNGTFTITVVDAVTFTYTFAGSTISPATATTEPILVAVAITTISATAPRTPILALTPESKSTYTLDKNLRPVVKAIPLTVLSIVNLTSVGTVATATTDGAHGLFVGATLEIRGANPTEYNAVITPARVVSIPTPDSFSYTFPGSGTSPATGTITACQVPAAFVAVDELGNHAGIVTAITKFKHGLTTGDTVTIEGAPFEYNGVVEVTVTGEKQFTYLSVFPDQPPATGATARFDKVSDDEVAITNCGAKDGNLWILYDALAPRGFAASLAPILRKFDPASGELIADVVRPEVLVGEYGAYKSLMDIGCGRLLTNNRDTHQVIAIKVESIEDRLTPVDPDMEITDTTIGTVVKRYGLVVNPLDAAVNSGATRLLYIDGPFVKLWDLEDDAFIRVVREVDVAGGGAGIGGGGGTSSSPCVAGGTPSASLPGWFRDALIAAGANKCYDVAIFVAVEATINANGGVIQRDTGCTVRPRIYFGTFGTTRCGGKQDLDFTKPATHVDIESRTGEWQWV